MFLMLACAGPGDDTGTPPTTEQSPCGDAPTWCNDADASGLFAEGPAYGRGAAAIDVDNDGWEDIWQADGNTNADGYAGESRVWRNQGDGSFLPMALGIDPSGFEANWSGAWADLDSDGDDDLLAVNGGYTGVGVLRLFRNDDATFTDVTATAGLPVEERSWWGASFADFDLDGLLDVAITATSKLGADPELFLGKGGGDLGFVDITVAAGMPTPIGDHKNPAWIDHDDDGDQDLYLAARDKQGGRPFFLRNDGGVLVDVSAEVMERGDQLQPVFSTFVADFDQDGRLDLYLGRWFEQDYIAHNQGDGTFELLGPEVGVDDRVEEQDYAVEPVENTMGLTVGDLHGDGWPDIVVGTGDPDHVGDALVFCSVGEGVRVERCSDPFVEQLAPTRHHGGAFADFDQDGDADFFYNLGGHPGVGEEEHAVSDFPALFRAWPDPALRTATVRLDGPVGNRNAFGARMAVTGDGGSVHHYVVTSTQGFQSQNSAWTVVALESAAGGTVEVRWPDGVVTQHVIAAGDRVTLTQ